jgi:hypothetical protein
MEQTKQEKENIRQSVREQTIGYIATALGLVSGLAWNEAIKGLIDMIYPAGNSGLGAKFLYAIVITVAIVIVSSYLLRFSQKKKD